MKETRIDILILDTLTTFFVCGFVGTTAVFVVVARSHGDKVEYFLVGPPQVVVKFAPYGIVHF